MPIDVHMLDRTVCSPPRLILASASVWAVNVRSSFVASAPRACTCSVVSARRRVGGPGVADGFYCQAHAAALEAILPELIDENERLESRRRRNLPGTPK